MSLTKNTKKNEVYLPKIYHLVKILITVSDCTTLHPHLSAHSGTQFIKNAVQLFSLMNEGDLILLGGDVRKQI